MIALDEVGFGPDAIVRVTLDIARAKWTDGDRGYIARQATWHHLAWQDCDCAAHACGGCAASIDIANHLDAEVEKIPLEVAEEARASAANTWQAERMIARDRLRRITLETAALGDDRRAQAKARRDAPGRYGSD